MAKIFSIVDGYFMEKDTNSLTWNLYRNVEVETVNKDTGKKEVKTVERTIAFGIPLKRVFEYVVTETAVEEAESLKQFIKLREHKVKKLLELFEVDTTPLERSSLRRMVRK